jgi:hypothetical protein
MLNNKGHVLSFDDSPIAENSPLDSISYNKIIDSLKSSTLRCVNRSRDLTSNLAKMNKALSAENLYLTSLIGSNTLGYSSEANTAIVTGYDALELSSIYNAKQSTLSGLVTISPTSKWSKVVRNLDRNGRNRASKDISISINGVTQPQDSDIYSMLDGYNDTYWLYDTVGGSDYTITINFPASIKPYVNYLSMIPFPAFGFTINSIYMLSADGTPHPLADMNSREAGILDVHFKPLLFGGTIQISIKAKGSVIGIADLDIGLEDYYQGTTPASFAFNVTAFKDKTFSMIDSINLDNVFLYNSETDASFIKSDKIKVYAYSSTGTYNPTASMTEISQNGITELASSKTAGQNFYLKFTMTEHLAQTPIFKSATIKYIGV